MHFIIPIHMHRSTGKREIEEGDQSFVLFSVFSSSVLCLFNCCSGEESSIINT